MFCWDGYSLPNLWRFMYKDYGSEVRGCHATEEIVDDEIIVDIPLRCLITVEMGKDTDVSSN